MTKFPSLQEVVRIVLWGAIGYMVSLGWLTEGLADQLLVVGLAVFTAGWRYLEPVINAWLHPEG